LRGCKTARLVLQTVQKSGNGHKTTVPFSVELMRGGRASWDGLEDGRMQTGIGVCGWVPGRRRCRAETHPLAEGAALGPPFQSSLRINKGTHCVRYPFRKIRCAVVWGVMLVVVGCGLWVVGCGLWVVNCGARDNRCVFVCVRACVRVDCGV
jgi:hypothetical protein